MSNVTTTIALATALCASGFGALGFASSASAATDYRVVAVSPNGDSGNITFVNPTTGEDTGPTIPQVANFPSGPADGLSELSGLAFNPTDGTLWGLSYACELITIDLETGVSTDVAETPITPDASSQCEGLAIDATGEVFAGHDSDVDPGRIAFYDSGTNSWTELTQNDFEHIMWLAYNPVSDRFVLSDAASTWALSSVASDGHSDLTALGPDFTNYSSFSFDDSGNSVAGYWGANYYVGGPSNLLSPAETDGSPTSTYWVAIDSVLFTEESTESLAPTGFDSSSLIGVAVFVIALLGTAFALRRPITRL